MERLWTPWRMTYVGGRKEPGCVFCSALAADDDVERLILLRREHCFLILNLYPYNSGHLMVVPYDHAADLGDLAPAARSELIELATLASEAARRALRCEGFNLGLNIGEIAGAGVARHLHLHVVPRWTGDANFMPILASTMVMPELLPVTYARLRAELESLLAAHESGATAQAGALVVLPGSGKIVLRRGSAGDVVLPKGQIEPGETAAAAALREVREETGIDATIAGWAGSSGYVVANSRRHISFLLATGTPSDELEHHLGSDTLVVDIDDAPGLITVPELRALVERNLPALRRLAGVE